MFGYCPPMTRSGEIELKILKQPHDQHRARYLTEGSRGAIRGPDGIGHPEVKLVGFNSYPVKLICFIGHDTNVGLPHLFYQASEITGKNLTKCSAERVEGTNVLIMEMRPENDMRVTVDCLGILKERNVDVERKVRRMKTEHSPPAISNGGNVMSLAEASSATGGVSPGAGDENSHSLSAVPKERSSKCRIVFRAFLPMMNEILQVVSSPIVCTQPQGSPYVSKRSLAAGHVSGGQEMFLVGKNFTKDCRIVWKNMNETWSRTVDPDKEYFHSTHLVSTVPPYDGPDRNFKTEHHVTFVVATGCGKYSDEISFRYANRPQDCPNCGSVPPAPSVVTSAPQPRLIQRQSSYEHQHHSSESPVHHQVQSPLNGHLQSGGGGLPPPRLSLRIENDRIRAHQFNDGNVSGGSTPVNYVPHPVVMGPITTSPQQSVHSSHSESSPEIVYSPPSLEQQQQQQQQQHQQQQIRQQQQQMQQQYNMMDTSPSATQKQHLGHVTEGLQVNRNLGQTSMAMMDVSSPPAASLQCGPPVTAGSVSQVSGQIMGHTPGSSGVPCPAAPPPSMVGSPMISGQNSHPLAIFMPRQGASQSSVLFMGPSSAGNQSPQVTATAPSTLQPCNTPTTPATNMHPLSGFVRPQQSINTIQLPNVGSLHVSSPPNSATSSPVSLSVPGAVNPNVNPLQLFLQQQQQAAVHQAMDQAKAQAVAAQAAAVAAHQSNQDVHMMAVAPVSSTSACDGSPQRTAPLGQVQAIVCRQESNGHQPLSNSICPQNPIMSQAQQINQQQQEQQNQQQQQQLHGQNTSVSTCGQSVITANFTVPFSQFDQYLM